MEISKAKAFFASSHLHISDEWLENCINWCKAEQLGPNYTLEELQKQLCEQWLMFDLRDLTVAVLPPNLASKQLYTLTGTFCLQMMQIVDISKPKLWQIQKIRNSNALTRGTQQDSEVVGTGKRLLQMTLSDGVQEVEAMEYQPVPCLSLNLAPGKKIRIEGPVVVRRGRLMLEPQNVKVLGGEVDDLLVANAAENVLARCLKLPQNPNPVAIEEKMLAVEKEEKEEGYVANFKSKAQPLQNSVKAIPDLTEEEELIMARELDMLLETEAELNQSKTPDLFDASDFEIVDKRSTSTQILQKKLSMSLDDDDDVFSNINIDAHLDEIDKQEAKLTPNIITISKLQQNKSNISRGVFRIKAKFKSVEEKLTIADDEFKLVIKVEDSTGDLIVRVHSDVVSDFAECSALAIINLKTNVLGKDEAAIEKMMKAITKVKDKLLELDGVMAVQVEKNKVPVITKIL